MGSFQKLSVFDQRSCALVNKTSISINILMPPERCEQMLHLYIVYMNVRSEM